MDKEICLHGYSMVEILCILWKKNDKNKCHMIDNNLKNHHKIVKIIIFWDKVPFYVIFAIVLFINLWKNNAVILSALIAWRAISRNVYVLILTLSNVLNMIVKPWSQWKPSKISCLLKISNVSSSSERKTKKNSILITNFALSILWINSDRIAVNCCKKNKTN